MLLEILLFVIESFPVFTLKGKSRSSACSDPGRFFLRRRLENKAGIVICK